MAGPVASDRSVAFVRNAALSLFLVLPFGLAHDAAGTRAAAQDVAALPQASAPYEMVRTLQMLQGQVAQGNTQAHLAQRTLLQHMNEMFLAAPPSTWADARNARAAVIHLLSGGHPDVIRKLLTLKAAPAVEEDLMRGALAYVDGRPEEARRLLSGYDPMDMAPNLGGQVALVRSALEVADNPKEAMRLLAIARLLMPGTLVEEAALRREVFVAGKLGDIEGFQSLSIRYLRRFRGSIYEGTSAAALDWRWTRWGSARTTTALPCWKVCWRNSMKIRAAASISAWPAGPWRAAIFRLPARPPSGPCRWLCPEPMTRPS
ncbi:hypothetical protein V6L77_14355 [Pannonibacter sp. Pt2-lr]